MKDKTICFKCGINTHLQEGLGIDSYGIHYCIDCYEKSTGQRAKLRCQN